MQKTGIIVVLLMSVTYGAGLRCYNCTYIDDGTGNPVGEPSCQDDDVSKFKIEDCPPQIGNSVPLCSFSVSNKTVWDLSEERITTRVERGCSLESSENGLGCHHYSSSIPGLKLSLDICNCKKDLCLGNAQTINYPTLLAYALAIGFLVLATEK